MAKKYIVKSRFTVLLCVGIYAGRTHTTRSIANLTIQVSLIFGVSGFFPLLFLLPPKMAFKKCKHHGGNLALAMAWYFMKTFL